LSLVAAAGAGEFAQLHAPFGFQPDIDDGDILLDADDCSLNDGTFLQIARDEGLFEHRGKIFTRGRGGSGLGHEFS
jgi:hypothetical protein